MGDFTFYPDPGPPPKPEPPTMEYSFDVRANFIQDTCKKEPECSFKLVDVWLEQVRFDLDNVAYDLEALKNLLDRMEP
jgi:hypothetical protein